jgi:membrane-associated phospholipid phosphatase
MHELIKIAAEYLVVVPVLGLAYVFYRARKPERIQMVIFMAISTVTAVVLVKIATTIHSDPRPFISDGVKPYFTSSHDNGFPSDHTVFSALIAFSVLRFSRRTGAALLIISLVIGSARVLANVHHGQDIVAGFCIAAICFGIASAVMRLLPQKNAAS